MEESNNNLSIFSFKLVIFICLFAIVALVLFIPYAPDEGSDSKYMYALNKLKDEDKKFEIAIFGNSYCYMGYDPTIFKSQLGLNTLHVNSPAQNLLTSLLTAKSLISENNFRYIIFDVSETSIITPKPTNEKSWHYQKIGLQELPLTLDKFYYVTKFYPFNIYPVSYATALSKNIGRFFRLNQRSKYRKKEELTDVVNSSPTDLFGFNGFIAKNKNYLNRKSFLTAINKKAGHRIPSDSLWTKDLKKLMQEVISISKENNVEVILINSLRLGNKIYKDEYLDSVIEYNTNVNFINLNENRDKYFLNENSFYNFSHLNYSGSFVVTQRIVDSMSQWYGLKKKSIKPFKMKFMDIEDVFYNLEEDQDKFIKLKFNRIPKTLNNHQLVIAIYPKDTSALSDYSKKKKWGSDNYYIKNPADVGIDVGKSKVIIKKFATKITEENLDKISIFFYKSKDTLNLTRVDLKN